MEEEQRPIRDDDLKLWEAEVSHPSVPPLMSGCQTASHLPLDRQAVVSCAQQGHG